MQVDIIELIEKFPNRYRLCNEDLNKFALLLRKGVYLYEYMNSCERFNEESLPLKKYFYDELNKKDIFEEDYAHALKVWEVFKIKNLGEYHDLYFQTDTLLLADVFENFRDMCLKIYKLDQPHFVSARGLSWEACLMTRKELELLTDKEMLYMFEKGTRGGMCQATHHYECANNKYIENYNENIALSFFQYEDANNLYGWPMIKKLPVGNFEWIEKDNLLEFGKEFIEKYDENSDKGFLYEVDVEYPKTIRMLHRDLPFLFERKKRGKVIKLVGTIEDKEKYVIHISALKQALNNGLILKKIHRIIQFNQEDWLKAYIEMNTKLRAAAKNDFEKYLFKLMNNSVFEKTMENLRKHRDIRLVTNDKQRYKLVSEPNYHSSKYISENLIIIEMKKTQIFMSKPIYLGQTILDVSKTLMYEFLYGYLKPNYRDKLKLCYMDTDSFIKHVETKDFYKDIADDVNEWFDTSNYDKNDKRPLPMGINKKVLGMFKDELGGKIMTEFVALRAKAYAFRW